MQYFFFLACSAVFEYLTAVESCTVTEFLFLIFVGSKRDVDRFQWSRGPRRSSAAARLLRLWFRIPPGTWMFVCVECCVLSCRGLCDELITRPEDSYRLWCVVVCDLEKLHEETIARVGLQ